MADLLRRLAAQGIHAKASVADAPGAAWAIARYGSQAIVPPGRSIDAVAGLADGGSASAAGRRSRPAPSWASSASASWPRMPRATDGAPLRQGGRPPARSGPRPCRSSRSTRWCPRDTPPPSGLRRTHRAARRSEACAQSSCGISVPAIWSGRISACAVSISSSSASIAAAWRCGSAPPAQRGRRAIWQAFRRATADGRSRLRHRSGRSRGQQGRTLERASDRSAGFQKRGRHGWRYGPSRRPARRAARAKAGLSASAWSRAMCPNAR